MAGNLFSKKLHSTFTQKVSNFPDNLYYFNDNDNLTTLMKILLGNSGTGQLQNLQIVAQLGQQHIEFSNLDEIMGLILQVKRLSSEIYSFATNPFIDQLTENNWQEIAQKDASYRERLLGAAEAFQTGSSLWGILTLCEAITQVKFYALESWRTPGYGRTGINPAQEIVLIPVSDTATASGGIFNFDQSKANALLTAIGQIVPSNFIISFGAPVKNLTAVTPTAVAATGYSEYFYLQPVVNGTQVNTPGTVQPGAATRYWVQNATITSAPYFAHLQTQESIIDLTGNVSSVTVVGNNPGGNPSDSLSLPSIQVTSTVYGAQ